MEAGSPESLRKFIAGYRYRQRVMGLYNSWKTLKAVWTEPDTDPQQHACLMDIVSKKMQRLPSRDRGLGQTKHISYLRRSTAKLMGHSTEEEHKKYQKDLDCLLRMGRALHELCEVFDTGVLALVSAHTYVYHSDLTHSRF